MNQTILPAMATIAAANFSTAPARQERETMRTMKRVITAALAAAVIGGAAMPANACSVCTYKGKEYSPGSERGFRCEGLNQKSVFVCKCAGTNCRWKTVKKREPRCSR